MPASYWRRFFRRYHQTPKPRTLKRRTGIRTPRTIPRILGLPDEVEEELVVLVVLVMLVTVGGFIGEGEVGDGGGGAGGSYV